MKIQRTRRDERGVIALVVAASMVVLCLAAAFAIDVGDVALHQRAAQHAVDEAAISGAELLGQQETTGQVVTATEAYLSENYPAVGTKSWDSCPSSDVPSGFSPPSGTTEDCITFNTSNTEIDVMMPPQTVSYGLGRVASLTSTTVSPSASAAVSGGGTAACAFCVLGTPGISMSGTETVAVTGGAIVDDASLTASGTVTLSATAIDVHGSITKSGTLNATPTPVQGAPSIPDPLSSIPAPTPINPAIPTTSTTCSSGSASASGGSVSMSGTCNVTLSPGNYSTISMSGSGTLTFQAGQYFITGSISGSGTGSISGSGVMLYFTCSSSSKVTACGTGYTGGNLALSGSMPVNLSPATSGTYAGLTIFYDRNNAAGLAISGSQNMAFTGTIYAKSSSLAVSGSSATFASMIVIGGYAVSGTETVSVSYSKSQNVQLAGGTAYLCNPGSSC